MQIFKFFKWKKCKIAKTENNRIEKRQLKLNHTVINRFIFSVSQNCIESVKMSRSLKKLFNSNVECKLVKTNFVKLGLKKYCSRASKNIIIF